MCERYCYDCQKLINIKFRHCKECQKCVDKNYHHCKKCQKCVITFNNFETVSCEECNEILFQMCINCGEKKGFHCLICDVCHTYKCYKRFCEKCEKTTDLSYFHCDRLGVCLLLEHYDEDGYLK